MVLNGTKAPSGLEGRLVFATSVNPRVDLAHESDALKDPLFGYEFLGPNGASVLARRIPEYCQWQEVCSTSCKVRGTYKPVD